MPEYSSSKISSELSVVYGGERIMNRILLRFVRFGQCQTALTSLLLLAGNAGNYLHPRCTAGCREKGTYCLVLSSPTRAQEIRPSLHCTKKHGV